MLIYIVVASFLVSAASLVGVFTLSFKKKLLSRMLLVLVALAAGTMIGNVFFLLLPESVELLPSRSAFSVVLLSFVLFFLIEKVLHWRHCHDGNCDVHTFGYMSLIGDAVHNFIDGLVIAASFLVSIPLGIATTVAIALHEIPQEIGDFAVLLHAGYSRRRALLLNFVVALGALVGAIFGYFLITSVGNISSYLVPFAAGGFLYIAASDLLPEVRRETETKRIVYIFLAFLTGVFLMYYISIDQDHNHGHGGVEDEHMHEEMIEDHGQDAEMHDNEVLQNDTHQNE